MRKVPQREEADSGANQWLSRAGRRYYLLYEVDWLILSASSWKMSSSSQDDCPRHLPLTVDAVIFTYFMSSHTSRYLPLVPTKWSLITTSCIFGPSAAQLTTYTGLFYRELQSPRQEKFQRSCSEYT